MNQTFLHVCGTDDFGAPNGAFSIQIDNLKDNTTINEIVLKEAKAYFFGESGCVVVDIHIPIYCKSAWEEACKITSSWLDNPTLEQMYSFMATSLNSEDHEVFLFTDPVFFNCFKTNTSLRLIISFNNLKTLMFKPELDEYIQFDQMLFNDENEEENTLDNEIFLLEEEKKNLMVINPVEEMIKNNYGKLQEKNDESIVRENNNIRMVEGNNAIRFSDDEEEL